MGAPQAVTAFDGATVWQAEWSPFGSVVIGQGKLTSHIRFPGQYFDEETGLHYNYYRHYNPDTGRYIESDPIGLLGGLNTFAYVDSDPVLYLDLDGLTKQDFNDAFDFAKSKGEEVGLMFPETCNWIPLPTGELGRGRGKRPPSGKNPQQIDINSDYFGEKLYCDDLKQLLSTIFHEAIHYSTDEYHSEGAKGCERYCDKITKAGRKLGNRYFREFLKSAGIKCKKDPLNLRPACICD